MFKSGLADNFDDTPMHGGGEGLDLGPVSRTTKFAFVFPIFLISASVFLFVSIKAMAVCKLGPQ
jgi:hypothetical protein